MRRLQGQHSRSGHRNRHAARRPLQSPLRLQFLRIQRSLLIDGVNYTARLHLQSSQTTLDWFVGTVPHQPRHSYVKNSMSAPAFVGPGQTFVLGPRLSSIVSMTLSPVRPQSSFPAPLPLLLLLGYGNLLPRSGEHLSFPVESRRRLHRRCSNKRLPQRDRLHHRRLRQLFNANADAQKFLKQEVHNPQRRSKAITRSFPLSLWDWPIASDLRCSYATPARSIDLNQTLRQRHVDPFRLCIHRHQKRLRKRNKHLIPLKRLTASSGAASSSRRPPSAVIANCTSSTTPTGFEPS